MLMESAREYWAVLLHIVNALRITTIPDIDKHVSCMLVRPYITSKSSMIYLWPLKRESPTNIGENNYNLTANKLAELAQDRWLRISSNTKSGIYQGFPPLDVIAEPKWPAEMDIDDLVVRAFGNRIIDTVEHEIFASLRAKTTV
jgi:hypothetical protein